MATATIRMKTDPTSAGIFKQASAEDRDKLCLLWSILLHEFQASPAPLTKLMDQIGAGARARGLTDRELESVLDAR